MLVLRCKAGDKITIGSVELHISKSTEANLGLAISAPKDFRINHVKNIEVASELGGTPKKPQTLHK